MEDITPTAYGWYVGDTPTHRVEVFRYIFNDRIVLVPHDRPEEVDRYWCYPKGGAALHAATAWLLSVHAGASEDDTEPTGWTKAHGERYPDK